MDYIACVINFEGVKIFNLSEQIFDTKEYH